MVFLVAFFVPLYDAQNDGFWLQRGLKVLLAVEAADSATTGLDEPIEHAKQKAAATQQLSVQVSKGAALASKLSPVVPFATTDVPPDVASAVACAKYTASHAKRVLSEAEAVNDALKEALGEAAKTGRMVEALRGRWNAAIKPLVVEEAHVVRLADCFTATELDAIAAGSTALMASEGSEESEGSEARIGRRWSEWRAARKHYQLPDLSAAEYRKGLNRVRLQASVRWHDERISAATNDGIDPVELVSLQRARKEALSELENLVAPIEKMNRRRTTLCARPRSRAREREGRYEFICHRHTPPDCLNAQRVPILDPTAGCAMRGVSSLVRVWSRACAPDLLILLLISLSAWLLTLLSATTELGRMDAAVGIQYSLGFTVIVVATVVLPSIECVWNVPLTAALLEGMVSLFLATLTQSSPEARSTASEYPGTAVCLCIVYGFALGLLLPLMLIFAIKCVHDPPFAPPPRPPTHTPVNPSRLTATDLSSERRQSGASAWRVV